MARQYRYRNNRYRSRSNIYKHNSNAWLQLGILLATDRRTADTYARLVRQKGVQGAKQTMWRYGWYYTTVKRGPYTSKVLKKRAPRRSMVRVP